MRNPIRSPSHVVTTSKTSNEERKILNRLLALIPHPRPSRQPAPGRPLPPSTPREIGPALSPAPDRSTTPSVPANVLALLQATSQAGPSAAAKEQSAQEAAEQEIERVLREAQGGGGPSSTAFARPSQPASTAYAPPASTPGAPPAPAASSGLSLDPAQLAVLQQIAGYQGGSAAAPAQLAQPAAPYGPGQGHDYGQSHGGHRHYGVDASGPGDGGGRGGHTPRPALPTPPPALPARRRARRGVRAARRAREATPDPDPSDGPLSQRRNDRSSRARFLLLFTRLSLAASASAPTPPAYPTPVGGQQQQPPPSTAGAPPPFNPSPSTRASPAAWSAFVDVLPRVRTRTSPPGGRGPAPTPTTMEESRWLCVPSGRRRVRWAVQSASPAPRRPGAAGGGRHAAVSGMMGTMAGGAGGEG
ncbi:SPOSA6832_05036 [Sporobolomyces salmonicolor]|uniref:SPOSA6832_05036-mRNA-1:cds n=1 Tax=Sporidiobolus salmonicolor TaxID=5005 RepID=A0A0D6ESR5_SPOSA|nr:SPOSA6832_05036 [Sporobolomyces salmonicolor]